MTSTKDVVRGLERTWQELSLRLSKVRDQIKVLEREKTALLEQLDALLKTFKTLGQQPSDLIIPPELMFEADASIGDAIVSVLEGRAPMTRLEIRKELQKAGMLKTKNPRIILANAIKKDARKRFKMKDGKVSLTKEGK